jgi:hypothetical protein
MIIGGRIKQAMIVSCTSEELFLAVYDKIARNRGAFTEVTENDTEDGMNLARR